METHKRGNFLYNETICTMRNIVTKRLKIKDKQVNRRFHFEIESFMSELPEKLHITHASAYSPLT
jgi:hypothetical protein